MSTRPETESLTSLEAADEFIRRHVGPSPADRAEMLEVLGVADIEELMEQVVPDSIRFRELEEELPAPRSEYHVLRDLTAFGKRNKVVRTCIGLGYYRTKLPAVIQRNVLENPGWYTAYTPYQPEISQGRLEALLNFQTMVADLCGTDMANASLLDEGTAAAEAMAMARRVGRSKSVKFFIDEDTHPQTIAVIETRAQPVGVEVVVGDPMTLDADAAKEYFGVLLSYPGSGGQVRDFAPVVEAVHAAGGLVSVTTDLLALCLLTPPGEWGADIIVGSSQRFGVPMMFGGPHAAFMACSSQYARNMPGRLVGVSTDASGRPANRLALQTREQHIRREKATSNICTAQVLLAMMAGMYATYHGPDGLRRIARRAHKYAGMLATALEAGAHHKVLDDTFFDTLAIRVEKKADDVIAAALARDVNLRKIDDRTVGVSFDEITDRALFIDVCAAFGVEFEEGDLDALARRAKEGIPPNLARRSEILVHPVFRSYHSEHDMLRYLRRLADRDLALDRTMIPLGSCTMKLNATTEMMALTMPEYAFMHPFAPIDQAEGYLALINQLRRFLVAATGYYDVSLQPNSGAQGEYAGLMAIRAYHLSRGDDQRTVCLIPQSAHGTNPASAAMVGMSVKVVKCNENGDVDLADLAVKIEEVGDKLAAIMITYPSTHGVFEIGVRKLCDMVHEAGGQVYIDGANMNALVGAARPGEFGGDVSHLNLHKTFAIPHGGGGPGVGPIGVAKHLQPFLPNHPLRPEAGPDTGVGPISAAPWGSAGVLSISWAYMRLMGGRGLTEATEAAILNANYIATRLSPYYRVLYTGDQGRVAHECILDLRDITKRTGVSVDDVAKRLIDFGFHAPTMSFPVAGTLMVEPTESEPKVELDRFIDAMIAIAEEIKDVEEGRMAIAESPLRHAPHTAEDLISDHWDRAYPREVGAYPKGRSRADRYFPPVNRIDNVAGDRNLICTCPPIEDYQD